MKDPRPQTLEQCEAELKDFFPPALVLWRPTVRNPQPGPVTVRACLPVRAVQARLDRVFGPDGWGVEYANPAGWVACTLRVRFPARSDKSPSDWVGRVECCPADYSTPHDTPYSMALKLAARCLGVGTYLERLGDQPAEWDGKALKVVPQIPPEFWPEGLRPAGAELADRAARLALAYCQDAGINVDRFTADWLKIKGYSEVLPLAAVRRQDVRELMRRVTDLAAARAKGQIESKGTVSSGADGHAGF